jgi:hypothetical protein
MVMEIFIVAVLLGLIPAVIASRKGRSFALWWFFGAVIFIAALPMAILMKSEDQQTQGSSLRKCPKCAEPIQPDASLCKHCRAEIVPLTNDEQRILNKKARESNHVPGWLTAVVLIAAVIGIWKMAGSDGSSAGTNVASTPASASEPPAKTGNATAPAVKATKEPESEWQYSGNKDEMRGAESRYASLEALNTIRLDFPYGEQRGRILVRQSAKSGFDILVGVPSGQIMCNSFSDSHINVKFDGGPIQRYGCSDASDGTSNMVFIQGAKRFLGELKKSKRAIVEVEFFHNGVEQMTFNTANLKWEN